MSEQAQEQAPWTAAGFTAAGERYNGAGEQLQVIRKDAFESFSRLGFPTTKDEDWRYTNVQPIARAALQVPRTAPAAPITAAALIPYLLSQAGPRLVFVDGFYSPALSDLSSLPAGVTAGPLEAALTAGDAASELVRRSIGSLAPASQQAFVALNTAFINDGACIIAGKATASESPVYLVFVASGREQLAVSPRVLLIAEESSKLTLVEHYIGMGAEAYLTNAVSELIVGPNAVVDHYKVQQENAAAYHVSTIEIHQQRSSTCSTSSFSFGGRLVRNEVNPTLDGEGCNTHMYGLSVLSEEQHVDNHTVLDHAKPHCESNEWYKGIYAGRSKGIFNGTIIVRPHAQKTNAIQSNQSLLLSREAQSNAKPQLKIWADDVKCTHGATVGALDEHALFYIRSRGISEHEARDMLIHAFAGDILGKVQLPQLRQALEELVHQKLVTLRVN